MRLLWICSLFSCGSCQPQPVKTVEVPATVNCVEVQGMRCFSVTGAFIEEHERLFIENIRLKARLAELEH